MDNKRTLSMLSDGIVRMPRKRTSREKFADDLYLFLQIGSKFTSLFAGIAGYAWYGLSGALGALLLGFITGWWIRRSLGIRGPNRGIGFFVRKCERAHGSRRGVMEWLIETIRGNEFTVQKCRAICAAYQETVAKVRGGADEAESARLLAELDRRVKEISYD